MHVKFIFDGARSGLFSSANILQRANVTLRVQCLCAVLAILFHLVLTLEMSEMYAIFVFTTKTTQPRPQVFSVKGALTCNFTALLTTSVDLIVKFFQSWSTVAGYGELCVCF